MNATCNECMQRCLPFDPRQPTVDLLFKQRCPYAYPRFNRPECESCPESPKEPEIKPIFRPRPIDKELDQLKAGFIHLQGKLNEHIDISKKKGKY